jgi:hypothetical protein
MEILITFYYMSAMKSLKYAKYSIYLWTIFIFCLCDGLTSEPKINILEISSMSHNPLIDPSSS